MTQVAKLASAAAVFLTSAGCVEMTPAEACAAICSEMAQCQVVISDSTLAPGPSCQADCEGRIQARGSGCKSSASYLADCFQTYTCSGIEFNCSDNASSFASDCG